MECRVQGSDLVVDAAVVVLVDKLDQNLVWDLGVWVLGSGFWVLSSGSRILAVGFRVWCVVFRVECSGFRV